MADEVASFLGKLAALLVDPIVRECCYLFQYRSNIENLKKELVKLNASRAGVKNQVEAAGYSGETVDPAMESWAHRVDEIETEATTFIGTTSNVDNKCFNMWCPNVKHRYVLSRNAMKLNRGIVNLKREGNSYAKSTHSPPPPGILTAMTAEDKLQELATWIDYTPSIKNTKDLGSRMSTFKRIMDALKDDKIGMIGISGMGGVGKTTFVNDVCREVREQCLFEELTMTAVSQKQDLLKIQDELAAMLGLKFKGENSVMTRAHYLHRRLTNGKKILVVIDDVWNAIPLKQVGIPGKEDRKRCKVLFTSRYENVFSDMGTQLNVKLDSLTHQEALRLFEENIGDCDRYLAMRIVDGCKGIPIAIVTVAKALMKREEAVWYYALDQLKESTGIDISAVDEDPAYNSVKLSYNLLNDNEAKMLLFICCLCQEDANISLETLVRFFTFPDIEVRRSKVYNLVGTLKSCKLLGEGNFHDTVKVHDIVRDACLSTEGMDYFGYKTSDSTFKELWHAVNDDNIHTIGLRGMAGVGKTEMVKKVCNMAHNHRNPFDEIAMAAVTRERDIFRVQYELGEMLGLSLRDTRNINTRAELLHERLSDESRSLVILDDVRERLDLQEIGIPKRGCKVIITTREEKVCREMGIQKNIELGLLSDEEAWDLFQKRSGLKVKVKVSTFYGEASVIIPPPGILLEEKWEDALSNEFHSIGRSIVRELGCLPLPVVHIARSLKNKDLRAWEGALAQLRKSSTETITVRKLNDLKDPEAKLLLLLCCIMGANTDIPIMRLVKCISSMQLFGNIEEIRIKIHRLVNLLGTDSLLTIVYQNHESVNNSTPSKSISVAELSSGPTAFVLDLKTDKDVTVRVNYDVRRMFLSLPPS